MNSLHQLTRYSTFFLFILLISCVDEQELAQEHVYDDQLYANCDQVREDTKVIVDELKTIIQPLDGIIANISDEQLSGIGDYLGQAKFVGLGEGTHGSHEFFEMKVRIFKYLVEYHDFKVMALEGSWAKGHEINKYVMEGIGDAEELVKNLQTGFWRNQEILNLIEWMRQYNLDHMDQQPISFYGIDVPFSQFEYQMLKTYFSEHSLELFELTDRLISPFTDVDTDGALRIYRMGENDKVLVINNLRTIVSAFEKQKEELISKSSEQEYEVIKQTFEVLIQGALYIRNDQGNNRDAYMTQNAEWLREHLGGVKIAIWAHNVHVSQDNPLWIGAQMKLKRGSDYRSVGTSFSSGSFWAYNPIDNNAMGFVEKTGCASLNSLYSEVGDQFYLIHDDLLQGSISKQYLDEYHPFYMVSTSYNPQFGQSQLAQYVITDAYDAIIFINSVTLSKLYQ